MFSWFPAYFPLRQPLVLKKGEEVVVDFWRCEDKHMVWYEWAVPSHCLPVHNPGGRSYFIGK
jgi:protein arginine N-methyltransferase 5